MSSCPHKQHTAENIVTPRILESNTVLPSLPSPYRHTPGQTLDETHTRRARMWMIHPSLDVTLRGRLSHWWLCLVCLLWVVGLLGLAGVGVTWCHG